MNSWPISQSLKNNKTVRKSNLSSIFPKKCPITSFNPMSTSKDKNSKDTVIRGDEKTFACYVCNKNFASQSEVIMHLKFIHNACAIRDCSRIADVRLHSSVCENRPFVCSVCYKKFPEKYLLQMHFNQHIDAAFYVCEICRDGFQQRKELQKHMLVVHEKHGTIPVTPSCTKRVYQKCTACLKYFQLFSEYEDHSFTCNSQNYKCGICKVDFSNFLSLESHEYIEHKEGVAVKGFLALKEGKRYFCGICYLGFTKGDILREHLKSHVTNDKIIDYICDECHSSFATDEDLQVHYLHHIEEHYVLQDVIRQHICDKCKMTFKTQKQLIDHSNSGLCMNTNVSSESSCLSGNLNDLNEGENLPDKQKSDLNINNGGTLELLEPDIFGSKPSDFPVYALKAGDELVNCDDSNCIIVIDRDSLFVLQRGICASECRMPDVSNAEAYNDTDVIDASLLQSHMLNILNVKEDNEILEENTLSSLTNEALSILEQKLNIDSESSGVLTINLSELNAQLASDPNFKNHQIYIESIPMNDCENSENSEASQTYKIIVDETLENIESNEIKPELALTEAINDENKMAYINDFVKEAVVQNQDLVNMT